MDGITEVARNLALGAAIESRLVNDLFAPERSGSAPRMGTAPEADGGVRADGAARGLGVPAADDPPGADGAPGTDEVRRTHGDVIAIVGGELFNKGAQAMTFTVVDELAERYPDHDLVLLSKRDYERDEVEKSQYAFDILPWGPELQLALLSHRLRAFNTDRYAEASGKVRETLASASFVVDVNGYRLSSQMGFNASLSQLATVQLARRFEVPMYLLPQSIGPFDYALPERLVLNPLFQVYLPYPRAIYAREPSGHDWLAPFTEHNVGTAFDVVLHHDDYDLDNIYEREPELRSYDVDAGAVGIVPNAKVFDRVDDEALYEAYEAIAEQLLVAGRSVYVLAHSTQDRNYCRRIADRLPDGDDVVAIDDDLTAVELESVLEQFDFVVASRYHSIVHAYKHRVPAIAIGWAPKYRELSAAFDQSRYHFDVRDGCVPDDLPGAVDRLSDDREAASRAIGQQLEEIRRRDLFASVFGR